MYYQSRLLAVAHNRVDCYIARRFRGLGAERYKEENIQQSDNQNIFTVQSHVHENIKYAVDLNQGMCTCTLGFNGEPTGEPCRHQAAVAKKYKLHSLNVLPTFSTDGRFLYATIASGKSAGPKSVYAGLRDSSNCTNNVPDDISNDVYRADQGIETYTDEKKDDSCTNLDLLLRTMDEVDKNYEKVSENATLLFDRFKQGLRQKI